MKDHPFRLWLQASGRTVREVAKACGVSRSAVYSWCSGESSPSVKHFNLLYKLSQGAVQPWFWSQEAQDGTP
jgi:transcriptional regulator with XRE-family HTH domain